ncbi:MAG: hypothetical protein GY950_26690 [bacterium]|nr:hypothetical protein [bacterium]
MKNMQAALLFLSYSMGPFALQLVINLFYFLVIIAVTVPVFFWGYTSGNDWVFLVFLGMVIPLGLLLRRYILFKRHLGLNVHFIRFFTHLEKNDGSLEGFAPGKVALPHDPRETRRSVRENLRKSGIWHISMKLSLAFTAADIAQFQPMPEGEAIKRLKRESMRLTFLEVVCFLVLFIPFVLISFLFTLSVSGPVKLLIFVLGFFFTWFLQAGIVLPISGLMLQRDFFK